MYEGELHENLRGAEKLISYCVQLGTESHGFETCTVYGNLETQVS
jgi:hypothetical protein